MEEFRQMIQERLTKVEEIQNCLKLSVVSLHCLKRGNVVSYASVALHLRTTGHQQDGP